MRRSLRTTDLIQNFSASEIAAPRLVPRNKPRKSLTMNPVALIALILFSPGFPSFCGTSLYGQDASEPSVDSVINELNYGAQPELVKDKLAWLWKNDSTNNMMLDLIKAHQSDEPKRRHGAGKALDILEQIFPQFAEDQDIEHVATFLSFDEYAPETYYNSEVRSYAEGLLSAIGSKAHPVLFRFIQDRTKFGTCRDLAGSIIYQIGDVSEEQLGILNSLLTDPNENRQVRLWAAAILTRQGQKSEQIASASFNELGDGTPYYRALAAATLEKAGDYNKRFSNKLAEVLSWEKTNYETAISTYNDRSRVFIFRRSPNQEITYTEEKEQSNASQNVRFIAAARASLARTLASHGNNQAEISQTLIDMFSAEPFPTINYANLGLATLDFASGTVGEFDLSVLPAFRYLGSPAVDKLLPLYNSDLKDARVRSRVIIALGYVGAPARAAIPLLFVDAYDKQKPFPLRAAAVKAIGRIGSAEPDAVIPKLIAVHQSRDLELDLRAAEALETVATQLAGSDSGVKFIGLLENALEEINHNDREEVKRSATTLGLAITTLKTRRWQLIFQSDIFRYGKYILPLLLLLLVWLVLLLFRPYYLFQINQKLSKLPIEYKLFGVIGGPLRYLLLVGFFHYRPRVLDAWLEKHVDNARRRFSNRNTVKERDSYVPLPVEFDERKISCLKSEDLKSLFKNTAVALMITGEGGTGKTSHACLIAKWAIADDEDLRLCKHYLFPILIEQDSEILLDPNANIVERAIQLQLRAYAQEDEVPTSELVQKLLKYKRIIIIIDGFTEIGESTRKKIMGDISRLPVNALIFTGRQAVYLEDYAPVSIRPMKIGGGYLSDFLGTYLTERRVRERFDDEEFFEVCRRMSLLSNSREVTALLVKLFADLVVAAKMNITKEDMPQNLPELVLYYINYLNRDFDQAETSNEKVHQLAKVVAWACLKDNFHPTQILTKEVLGELASNGNGANLLEHLEQKLQLIRRVGMSRERLRFPLEPLAEYLAAIHITEILGQSDAEWKQLLSRLESQAPDADERGFINALQDCCETKYAQSLPTFVRAALAKISGVEIGDLKKDATEKRVRQIIHSLNSLEAEDLFKIRRELSLHERRFGAG